MKAMNYLLVGGVAALIIAERVFARRPGREAEPRRTLRNLALGATALAVVQTIEAPLTAALAARGERTGTGLVRLLPQPLRDLAAFLLLDWSMYLWHRATHRVPLLWRLHRVHHLDRDLDMSTALRFHMLDMLVSQGLRVAQLRLIGPSPAAWRAWSGFFGAAVLFHHSNLALSPQLERRLRLVLVTPAMHDIHHNAERDRTDSNWSSGLSLWDRLHGSWRGDLDLAVAIGIPAYGPADARLETSMRMPFLPPRDDWTAA